MKAALIQMNSGSDKRANLVRLRELVSCEVATSKPDWLLFPEHVEWMGPSTQIGRIAEQSAGGPAYEVFRALARQHRVWVHAGSIYEQSPKEGLVYNTTFVFDREGNEVVRYRKIHLFDVVTPDGMRYWESERVLPGSDIVTYDCEGVTVGCAICYDLRFPELFQALMTRGIKLLTLPSAFTEPTGRDHWHVLLRARAIETGCWIAAAGQWGAHESVSGARQSYGHSLIADPWGRIVCELAEGEGAITADLNMTVLDKVRAQIPVAQHKAIGLRAHP
jgi:deaminated glutathione amidase